MKFATGILAGVLMLATGSFLSATAETNSLSTTAGNFTPTELSRTFGWILAQEKEVNGIEINSPELVLFVEGFSEGCKDQQLPFAAPGIFPDVQALANARQEKVFRAIEQRGAKAEEAFLRHWQETAEVTELPDGVCYQILHPGRGAPSRPTQTLNVHYVARLVNGTELSEFGPDNIILITNRLNRGLFECLQKIASGGKMKLLLPPALSKHEIEMAGAPRGSAIVCEIEVLGITNTPAAELVDAFVPAAPESPPAAYSGQFPTNEVFEAWGWQLAQQSRISKMTLNEAELAALTNGFEIGVCGRSLPKNVEEIRPAVEKFVSERKAQFDAAFRRNQTADMNALFSRLQKNPHVHVLPDGLRYEILQGGEGRIPRPGQIVLVNYTASLIDGHVFDRTMNEPLHVEVGRVIPGWNEGIQKIGVGGKIRLYIPPSLGYGSNAVSGIPADSTLIYDIELVGIEDGAGR